MSLPADGVQPHYMRLSESERAAVADVDDNCLTEYLEDEADGSSLIAGDNRCAATHVSVVTDAVAQP